MKKVKPEELLSYGVHLGHKKQRVHPRARKFIHKIESGVSIIDLFQTAERLETACTIAKSLGKSKKVLLLVGTKRVARDVIRDAGQKHNLPYVSQKWVGGLLTNFAEISKNVKRIKDMRSEQDEGTWKKLPKHEQVALEKKLNRIASIYDGVISMANLPDALFIVDIKKEKNAIMEARRLSIPIIAFVDTNANPELVDHPIPGNDDAASSVKYITDKIVEAYAQGFSKAKD